MNDLMRQAQMMQRKIAKLQEELGSRVIEASAGGGMVSVKATGKQELVEIRIDPGVVDASDVEMLQDLILAAVNEALTQSRSMVQSEMSKLTGGINIPGLF
jgi:nucleoid-associated protein EbfC